MINRLKNLKRVFRNTWAALKVEMEFYFDFLVLKKNAAKVSTWNLEAKGLILEHLIMMCN